METLLDRTFGNDSLRIRLYWWGAAVLWFLQVVLWVVLINTGFNSEDLDIFLAAVTYVGCCGGLYLVLLAPLVSFVLSVALVSLGIIGLVFAAALVAVFGIEAAVLLEQLGLIDSLDW